MGAGVEDEEFAEGVHCSTGAVLHSIDVAKVSLPVCIGKSELFRVFLVLSSRFSISF